MRFLIARGTVGNFLQRASDRLFGYDYFISYKQDDGRNLPRRLASRLADAGYRVFLDETGYAPGDDLRLGTIRRVRMSTYTLLIARPGALTRSDWVVSEIKACLDARKTPIIIDIHRAFLTVQGLDDDERQRVASLRTLLMDRLRIEEAVGADNLSFDGSPSERLITELRRSFRGRRQDTRRARAFGTAAIAFAVLAVAAIVFAINATRARSDAEAQTRRARGGELAAQARLIETLHPQLGGLLATEAAAVTASAGEPLPPTSFQALLETAIGLSGRGLPPLGDGLRSLGFSPDGRQLVTGEETGNAWLWQIDGDQASSVKLAGAGALNVNHASFGVNSRWLMTSGDGGDGCLWPLAAGHTPACKPLAPFSGAFFLDPTVSPDGHWLVAPENKDAVWIWDLSNPAETPTARQIGQSVKSAREAVFSRNSRWLAVRSVSSKEIALWDLADPLGKVRRLDSPASEIEAVDLRDEPPGMVAADDHGGVYLWNGLGIGSPPARVLSAATTDMEPLDLRFDRTGTRLAVALARNDDPESLLLLWQFGSASIDPRRVKVNGRVRRLDFDPAGRFLYIEGLDGKLWLLDVASDPQAEPISLPGHAATVTQHVFSRNGKRLMTGDNDGRLTFWDLSCPGGLTSPIAMRGHEGSINALAADPAGEKWLASVSADGTARLWDLTLPVPGDQLVTAYDCAGLDHFVSSPDRHWLALATKAGDVSVQDLSARDPIASTRKLAEGLGELESIWFAPNGRWVAAVTKDDTIKLWDLSAPDPRASRQRVTLHHKTETTVAPYVSISFAVISRGWCRPIQRGALGLPILPRVPHTAGYWAARSTTQGSARMAAGWRGLITIPSVCGTSRRHATAFGWNPRRQTPML